MVGGVLVSNTMCPSCIGTILGRHAHGAKRQMGAARREISHRETALAAAEKSGLQETHLQKRLEKGHHLIGYVPIGAV